MALGLLRQMVEAQRERNFLWWAPAFAAGAGLYVSLADEPPVLLGAAVLGLALMLMWFGRAVPVLLLAAMACAGFAAAKFKTEMVAAPVLMASSTEVKLTGRVEKVEQAARKRLTIILSPHAIEGLAAEKLPGRFAFPRRKRSEGPWSALWSRPLRGSRRCHPLSSRMGSIMAGHCGLTALAQRGASRPRWSTCRHPYPGTP